MSDTPEPVVASSTSLDDMIHSDIETIILPMATCSGPVPTTYTRGSVDPTIRYQELCRLYTTVMQEINEKIEAVKVQACGHPGTVSRTAFSSKLRPSVYHINEMIRYGPLVGGAELAWKAALYLARCSVADDQIFDVTGDERECDRHHERLDRRFATICKLQKDCGKAYWLNEERVAELEAVKQRTNALYRYPLTTEHLRQALDD
ncbi:hypothetical protein Slin14017_G005760 [Septoria linicola]|nr:hypothetical protein Slin14017_G005760 [Septoria linicola]